MYFMNIYDKYANSDIRHFKEMTPETEQATNKKPLRATLQKGVVPLAAVE